MSPRLLAYAALGVAIGIGISVLRGPLTRPEAIQQGIVSGLVLVAIAVYWYRGR